MGKRVKFKLGNKEQEFTFTLGEILDAIEANGLEQLHDTFWDRYPKFGGYTTIGAACAVGQGAINLGVHYSGLSGALQRISLTKKGQPISSSIYQRNDGSGWGLKAIANYQRKRYADKLSESITFLAYPLTDIEWLDDDA